MTPSSELDVIRRAYAKQVTAEVDVGDPRIAAAFADVRREAFLGPGPWQISRIHGYVWTPDADPTYLYVDHPVGMAVDRLINNGQPSLHAALLQHAAPKEGEHIVHIGVGLGYFTAIMAHLVGPSGRVTAIEFELDLAARAAANLRDFPNVRVIQGDGATAPFDAADVIYVNAGATRPANSWLDRLAEGGRLILPLTTDQGGVTKDRRAFRDRNLMARRGCVFRIQRRSTDYLAKWLLPVAIYPCQGLRDEASEQALAAALDGGNWDAVTRLYRNGNVPAERCWLAGPDWCLAYS